MTSGRVEFFSWLSWDINAAGTRSRTLLLFKLLFPVLFSRFTE